jgi:hypothetical protein
MAFYRLCPGGLGLEGGNVCLALAFSMGLDGFRMDGWDFFFIDDACMKNSFRELEKMAWKAIVVGWYGIGGVVCLCLERGE